MATSGPNPGPERLETAVHALRGLRSRARAALALQRLALVATLILLAAPSLILLDYFLRFPGWIRGFHLVVGVGALAALFVRLILPALRFRPSLASVALRVERSRPELKGTLASAVEFAADRRRAVGGASRALESAVIDRAADSFGAGGARGLLRLGALGRRSLQLALVCAGVALLASANPGLARIGAVRLATPWSDAQWPKRTAIIDATSIAVHPRGAALPLRAAITRSHRDLDTTYAAVQRRGLDESGRALGPVRTSLLTHQRRTVSLPGDKRGALFERLVEADAPLIEYRFVSDDDATAWRRIRIVDPPAVAAARATITPPAYAASIGEGPFTSPSDADLGAGLDERAHAPPALAGSVVELTLTLNKPIPAKPEDPEWLSRTLGDDAFHAGVSLDADAERWRIRFTLADTVRIPLFLRDEHDIPSVDEAVFRFEAVADREPSVSITEPSADVAVLPTAALRITAEGRDEVALASVWLERQVVRPLGARQPSGPGGALEPVGEPAELVRADAASQRSARVELELALASLDVRPGDEVHLTAFATDALGAFVPAGEPGARAPSRSSVRILRIISEAELVEEIRAELNAVRQTAIRIDAQQGDVSDQTAARGSDRRTRAGQSQVGDRLARQQESLSRLRERAERNGLDDERLNAMLSDAQSATARAGQASGQASQTLEEAAAEARDAADPDAPRHDSDAAASLSEQEQERVGAEQQRVRDELAALIEALDAGQDGWVARRQIERLLREQGENRDATRRAGAGAAGLSPEQLSAEQREALQQVADKQNELADEARRLAEDLPQRAEQVRKQDPAAAAGMEQAARSARNNQIAQKMDQAGQQAQQNQTGDAARSQQQAMDALQDMLEELDKGERSRQEQLRRQLASLIASIQALIVAQTAELARLDAAAPDAPPDPDIHDAPAPAPVSLAGLDTGMIALARNTAGALDQAQGAGREVAPVARLIARAGEAQGASIPALRANQAPPARRAEQDSLARLNEALEQARAADAEQAEAEADRKKAELRRAYGAILERQIAARDQAVPFADVAEPSRRDRASIRAIGDEQISIREALAELQRGTREIADALVFDYAHQRLDAATASAGESLRSVAVSRALPQQARAIKGLRDLLASLADSDPRKKDFNEGAAGQGGGGGQGMSGPQPVIPPLSQLRLLRAIQSDVAADTRLAAETRATPDELARLAEDQKELADRGAALLEELANQARPQSPSELLPTPLPPAPAPEQPAPPAEDAPRSPEPEPEETP